MAISKKYNFRKQTCVFVKKRFLVPLAWNHPTVQTGCRISGLDLRLLWRTAVCSLPAAAFHPRGGSLEMMNELIHTVCSYLSVRDIPNMHYICLDVRTQTKFGSLALKSQGIVQLSLTSISHVKYIQKKVTFSTRLSLISLCSLKIL